MPILNYLVYILLLLSITLAVLLIRNMLSSRAIEELDIYDAILSSEELERHAADLARMHTTSKRNHVYHSLEARMNRNFKYIIYVYKLLNEHSGGLRRSTPASEWLLDNFYIIEEQVKEIRQNISRDYFYQLPRLKGGSLKGYPRVYAIALELISHTDGRFDEKTLINFITSYQTQALLTSGELWTLPVMVRMALIENIRRICEKIIVSHQQWYKADKLADLLLEHKDKRQGEFLEIAKEYMQQMESIDTSFGEHLLKRLKKHGLETALIIRYIDDRLTEQHTNSEGIAQLEHREQAIRQVAMGNSITSIKLISTLEWTDIFEKLSQVEQILRQDTSGIYSDMDFKSRDHYRHEIEKLSKQYKQSEILIAKKLIELSTEQNKHIGYFLFKEEKKQFIAHIGGKVGSKLPTELLYLGAIILLTGMLILPLAYYAITSNASLLQTVLVVLLSIIPLSDVSVTIVNWIVTHSVKPSFLPRLELKEGIPEEGRTIVVIPTLLTSKQRAVQLIENLEEYYLANKERNLCFALVGDFKDSSSAETSDDMLIVESARKQIRQLNETYSKDKDIFFYFHRVRTYNKTDGKYMGWERKRGALEELNELLLGSQKTSYKHIEGNTADLGSLKYVITLDADTRLIFDTAKQLIGTMLHPLNRPILNEKKGIISEGYGLLQPRINIDIESANATAFSRTFAGQGGIDIYTTAISDVYQDLFEEGIFTGKGIYDLNVFHSILSSAIPENAILSHDLIEGSYVRTGLVTDIELFDGFPSKYNAHAMRQHRWVRGDWQLLPWLFGKVKNRAGQTVTNPLPAITRWKITDNLRRSLLAPANLIFIAAALTLAAGDFSLWLSVAIGSYLFSTLAAILEISLGKARRSFRAHYFNPIREQITNLFIQAILLLACMPYQAYLMSNAIVKTIGRVFFTQKNMLEWVTAADMEAGLKNDLNSYIRRMWHCYAASALLLAYGFFARPEILGAAILLSLFWVMGPVLAYYISRPQEKHDYQLNHEDIKLVRRTARKTWGFFEDFVTVLDNYLPPDNYQHNPPNGIAHRTSPTNIGLLLLSTLAARDMGYIATTDLIDRLSKSIKSIEKLKKWKGHLYNWYDTVTMEVLRPRYISTVDSGNFVACLMALKQGLLEYMNKPLLDSSLAKGLVDTIELANEELENMLDPSFLQSSTKNYQMNAEAWYRFIDDMKLNTEHRKNRWGYKLYKHLIHIKDEIEIFLPKAVYLTEFQSGDNSNVDPSFIEDLTAPLQMGVSINEAIELYPKLIMKCDAYIKEWSNKKDETSNIATYKEFRKDAERCHAEILKLKAQIEALMKKVDLIAEQTEFAPLYCTKRKLFSIGYNVDEEQLTKSFYDLMASEARQASLIAIARGEVKREHWLMLDRTLTMADGKMGLVSWTGTMFEYLMPLLLMKNYTKTLWDETYRFVIRSQQEYGRKRKVPWGVSESGFFSFDYRLNYQYKAFGIPSLGLKRGLVNDTVISPYSTLLALAVAPKDSVENLKRLTKEGLEGQHGYYEAADYTRERLTKGGCSVVQSYMAHHQGMGLVAMDNLLYHNIMQQRFHKDPYIRAAEILLQEKVPSRVIFAKDYKEKIEPINEEDRRSVEYSTVLEQKQRQLPESYIMSNGSYSVMLTEDGSGYSKYNDLSVTRWREDGVLSHYGTYLYLRDTDTNIVWKATVSPESGKHSCKVTYSQDKAIYNINYEKLDCQTEVIVSPEDNVEIRRISITNHTQQPKTIETTSYSEVVLAPQSSDLAHPAFSNLFIKTEFVSKYHSLLAVRKPREEHKKPIWLVHTLSLDSDYLGGIQYETDRSKFIGRGRDITNPLAIENNHPLSNTTGAVIDPIISLRGRVRIEPGQTVSVSYITGVAENKEKAIELAEKYSERTSIERAFELAWTRSQVELSYLNLTAEEMESYRQMLAHILFLSPTRKKVAQSIVNNKKGQSGLWAYGISGDIPIVLVVVRNSDDVDFVHQVIKAHEFWRVRGLNIDLVIMTEDQASYTQPVHNYIQDLISITHARDLRDRPGGVFLRQGGNMPEADRNLLMASARLVLYAHEGAIASQLNSKEKYSDSSIAAWKTHKEDFRQYTANLPELQFYNGYGGFDLNGSEYVIRLQQGQNTPLPWINVITNGSFGFQISESGGGYTWAENSRENKLTVWSNDPVIDPQSEVIYIRDDDTGDYWSATPQPVRTKNDYIVRHGFGYSVFESSNLEIAHNLTMFTPLKEPVKLNILRVKNNSKSTRRLSIYSYIRPVLGVAEQSNAQYIFTKAHDSGAVLAMNGYNNDFPDRMLFLDSSLMHQSFSGDRREFLGKDGSLKEPLAMKKETLSGSVGAGLDPCCTIQDVIELQSGKEQTVIIMLGQATAEKEIKQISNRYKSVGKCKQALDEVVKYWRDMLTSIQVKTPDASMDIMLNGWLLYQTVACRIWARAALYQAGGAYGFRDQLQDSMAVAYIKPELTRKQILYHSEHQFIEGDVQHWWHPGTDRGIRTRFSDDLLWMPFVTADYLKCTGDFSILTEQTGYIDEACLKENEDERYNKPCISEETTTLYEHCIRAIEHSLKFGQHGIPLMGSGDWNDGMSTVGNKGRGESVWLGWFLYSILESFTGICEYMNEPQRAERYKNIAGEIRKSVEENAWDGNWYRRAYFDNGIPLGSAENTECKIDSLAQSWAVISGAGNPERIKTAFESLDRYLINREEGIILLLTPPFDEGDLQPGYIKGYIPGVRENGGQYTHAAAWVVMAYAQLGNGDKAWELYNMLIPINHANTAMEAARYKVEPYVMSADVYAVAPHVGRGGWSWYTGASGWMYRVGIQHILGLNKEGDGLYINPSIPKHWNEYHMHYRYKETMYHLQILNPDHVNTGVKAIVVDGVTLDNNRKIDLIDDGAEHMVLITMG